MSKTKIFIHSVVGGAVLALAIKKLAGRLFRAQHGPRPAPHNEPYAAIDTYIEEQMARLSIPGLALAIVEGDQIVYMRGFGRAHPGGAAPTPQTPFFIGSLTKSFTALAVMQLVEAGKIELDAPVQRYLPWFRVADPRASAQMTVRHLLNQTSGFSTWSGWETPSNIDNRPGATERRARALSTCELNHPPGAAYEYSNTNYDLLGLVIEAAGGALYTDTIQSHIFDPLGMRHSYTAQAEAKRNGLAVGHQFWFWRPIALTGLTMPVESLPSGLLISCAEDMGRYLIAQLNDGRFGERQILSGAGMAEMQRGTAAIDTMGWKAQYAMGWYDEDHGGTRLIWHTGMVPDFSAYMALLPEQKKGLVLLLNADHFMMNPVITEFGAEAAARLAGLDPVPASFGFSFIKVVPWAIRALLLIPLLQILGVITTARQLRRWHQDPRVRPGRARLWAQHILLPLIPNLALAALPLFLRVKKKLGFLLLYFPDFSWIAILGGAFAGIWAILRTSLILRLPRNPSQRSKI